MSCAMDLKPSGDFGSMPASVPSKYGIHLFLLILIAVSGAMSPAFLSGANISDMLLQMAPVGIVVIDQAYVIILRSLDLFVASTMATAAVIATGFSGGNADVPAIIAISIRVGVVTGLANGLLVTKRDV